jgi:hypothetical protein
MMQLIIDCVPYECEQPNPCTLVLFSEYYAAKLAVPVRYRGKCEGFWVGNQFVDVVADVEDGTITFSSRLPVTLDLVGDWFWSHFDAIKEIGFEALEREIYG